MVTLEYTLKDETQAVLDSSEKMGPLDYIHGYHFLIPGLERALTNREQGESFSLTVPPKDAYGEILEDAVFKVPRSQFPADIDLQVGMAFEAQHHPVVIQAIDDDGVLLNANHPLAGKTLYFDIKIVEVRTATEDEIAAALQPPESCSCGGSCNHDEQDDGSHCCGCSGCH